MARDGIYDVALLVAGDRDFAEAVRIVQDEMGRQVYLYAPTGAGVATELHNMADAYGEMDLSTLDRIMVPRASSPRSAQASQGTQESS